MSIDMSQNINNDIRLQKTLKPHNPHIHQIPSRDVFHPSKTAFRQIGHWFYIIWLQPHCLYRGMELHYTTPVFFIPDLITTLWHKFGETYDGSYALYTQRYVLLEVYYLPWKNNHIRIGSKRFLCKQLCKRTKWNRTVVRGILCNPVVDEKICHYTCQPHLHILLLEAHPVINDNTLHAYVKVHSISYQMAKEFCKGCFGFVCRFTYILIRRGLSKFQKVYSILIIVNYYDITV